jgi:ribosomal protein L18
MFRLSMIRSGHTLASASSIDHDLRRKWMANKTEQARRVGKELAERAKAQRH